MTAPRRLYLVAAEPSGDELGAQLCRHLDELSDRPVEFSGAGGPRMGAFGVPQPFDMRELAVMGIVEGLTVYSKVIHYADMLAQEAARMPLDAAVLIDSWGFTIRVAQRLKKLRPDLPIIKYVAPQVWASRKGRARSLAKAADHVLTLHPFEPAYFEKVGLPATFVGQPALDVPPAGNGAAFRERYGLGDRIVVLVLFGSRQAEWQNLSESFLETLVELHARHGDRIAMIAPLSENIATRARARLATLPQEACPLMVVDEPEKEDAFAAGDIALACSGTVVTQLAMQGVPTVVAYRLSPLGYAIARLYVHLPHISIVNMAAEKRLFPEFVQAEARPRAMADALTTWIDDPASRRNVSEEALATIARMRGDGGAGVRAAEAVLDILARHEIEPPRGGTAL